MSILIMPVKYSLVCYLYIHTVSGTLVFFILFFNGNFFFFTYLIHFSLYTLLVFYSNSVLSHIMTLPDILRKLASN